MKPSPALIRHCAAALLAVAAIGLGQAVASAGAADVVTWGRILIIGDGPYGACREKCGAELYDPSSNRFATDPPFIGQVRIEATATVIRMGLNAGKVLVAGGYNEGGPLTSTELFDPATDRSSPGPEMKDERNSHTATVIPSGPHAGRIIIVGGDQTELYDPVANIFAPGPPVNGSRWDHTATVITSGPNAAKILFAGGWREIVRSLASTELYDPVTNRFVTPAQTATMKVARESHTATVLTTGPNAEKILIAGGRGNRKRYDPLASTELYDPTSNRFTKRTHAATMKVPRAYHTATLITSGPNDGKILIAGGQQGINDVLSSTELYDPLTDRFSTGPAMHSGRTHHVAITIASGPNAGKILIAGGAGAQCASGRGCTFVQLASSELYDPTTNTFAPGPTMHGALGSGTAVQLPPSPPERRTAIP